MVRFQNTQTLRKVLEVSIVELVGRHDVVEDGEGRVSFVICTSLLKPLSVARVVGGVGEVGDELGAVGESDGVGPTESHEFFD